MNSAMIPDFPVVDAQILRMIRKHGSHRVIFGTDAPWQEPGKILKALFALPLEHDEFRRICCENSRELFKLPV